MKITRRQLRRLINEVVAGESGNRTEFSSDECAMALGIIDDYRANALVVDLPQDGLDFKEKLINCVLTNKGLTPQDLSAEETQMMNMCLDDIGSSKQDMLDYAHHGRNIAKYGTESGEKSAMLLKRK
jgi:hypothetical protein|tara:strand:- start:4106 stop:4486 length:381 start_codon:yes stop_codon:yes gene_type:complete